MSAEAVLDTQPVPLVGKSHDLLSDNDLLRIPSSHRCSRLYKLTSNWCRIHRQREFVGVSPKMLGGCFDQISFVFLEPLDQFA
eukprot:scaffold31414_cov183-Amphora_coffeaeformis.AAC.13